uniref:Putative ovule protein n=1 Tax=Solanum chacoense TaxID=4108 RepID=A0A0V0ISE2_SOLCH
MIRPSDRGGFDRQASWGNPMGRPEHRLRPGSAGATRNFDEKTPFLSNNAPIGRNFDEDERKPLDGSSGPRRTVSDESIRALPSRVEPKVEYSVTGMVGSGQVSAPPSQNPRGAASWFNESTSMGASTKGSVGGSGRSVSSRNVSASSAQVVTGSYPNAWGLRKEVASAKESVSAPWSAPDAESKLAHASALEKVTSGRWHSKQQIHSQMDVEVVKHQDTEKELYYHGSTTVNDSVYNMPDVVGGPEYSDQVLAVHAERNLVLTDGVHGFNKDLPARERARSPLFMETNERKTSSNVTGLQRPHNVVSSGGYEMQSPASSEPSERPKLKLLPRSKPLENLEQSIDYKQVNQQPSNPVRVEKLADAYPTVDPTKTGFVEHERSNQVTERPKLNLKPRSQLLEQSEGNTENKRKPLFGGARPREMVLQNRGIDDVIHNHDLQQPHPRGKQHAGKAEAVMHATRHNEKTESIPIDHRMAKNADRRDHRIDVEKGDGQRRNWRSENWRNNKETERHHHHHHQPQQHVQERPPSPETWRKPVEPPRPASADAPGARYGKATSAVELAAAFSKSVSDPATTTDRFSGQKSLPNRGQIPFSRLTGPQQRPQINGY